MMNRINRTQMVKMRMQILMLMIKAWMAHQTEPNNLTIPVKWTNQTSQQDPIDLIHLETVMT